jgi:hypothetical protein
MKLYEHQKKIIKENKKKVGLFLGTGSAKTATALHLAEGKILCITPKLQREEKNFIREAQKWGMKLDITQISKEEFKKYANTLEQFDTVILDEVHTQAGVTPSIRWVKKEPRPKASQTYDSLIEYLNRCPPKRLYVLTATPTRSPMCVWGISQILGYDWDFYKFRDAFYIRIKKGFREFFIPKNDVATKERMGRIVRHLGYTGKLDDYFDVPDQIYKEIHVELTSEQKRRIEKVTIEFPDPLVLIGKKHQIENGVLNGDQFSDSEIIKDNKIDVIKDLALEFPKMIIFAKYTMQIQKIKDALKDDYTVFTLQGETKNRAQVIKDAEMSDSCILIIQSQISAGFELPSFPVMVFASQSYSVVDRVQSEGRILRANRLKKNLYITLVAKGGIDQAVCESIKNKVDFSEYIYAKERS